MQYDYRCPDCNSEMTIERSIHEEPRDIPMVRKWDSPAITFKGKGFYSNGG
jgi:predicted nucleic acid-binding Zn ribbon protein